METETPAVNIEASADLGVVYTFAGKELAPFGWAQETLWRRLQVGNDSAEMAATLVYICLQPIKRLVKVRSDEDRAEFLVEVAEWAEKHKAGWIHQKNGTGTCHELVRIADQIWSAIEAASSEPDLKNEIGTESPNA